MTTAVTDLALKAAARKRDIDITGPRLAPASTPASVPAATATGGAARGRGGGAAVAKRPRTWLFAASRSPHCVPPADSPSPSAPRRRASSAKFEVRVILIAYLLQPTAWLFLWI